MKRFSTILTKLLSLMLVVIMSLSTALLTSCKKKKGESESTTTSAPESESESKAPAKLYNNETDPLVFSSAEVDKVFNPFFSTNAADSSVVGLTQIGMLSNDKDGNPVYGEEYPTVVLDMEISDNGREEDNGLQTTYKFVLKNNVRFSDGSYLTIKDVLFNLYVYLDPVYTGSSTIYSTDIVGLDAYRTNSRNETDQKNFMDKFNVEADARIDALYEAIVEGKEYEADGVTASVDEGIELFVEEMAGIDTYDHVLEDLASTKRLFKEELETDFSNSMDSYSETKFYDENGTAYEDLIKSDVEMFLYNEGCIVWNKKEKKLVYNIANPSDIETWNKETAINNVYNYFIDDLDSIITMWNTSITLREYIVNAEMSEYFASVEGGINNVEGIKFANRTSAQTVNGKSYSFEGYDDNGKAIGNEVLSITINNIDPKAIWNFSFGVAPMSYYSSAEEIEEFDFENHFGVKKGNQDFMQKVVKNSDKLGIPMGAGPYAASRSSGGITNVKEGEFYEKGMIYFERNPYYVLGPAKIKQVRYRVVPSKDMLKSLYYGDVDFAEPNAKPETEAELNGKKKDGFENKSIRTMGYGYIGVNAGKIPFIKVRQAIMHSINTALCVAYYKTSAQAIHRPMSLESWAYPKGSTAYYPYVGAPIPEDLSVVNPDYKNFVTKKGYKAGDKMDLEDQKEFITELVKAAGFTMGGDGIYVNGSYKLDYTFTIAGEETDHPAWDAMYQAAQFLNTIGWNVVAKTDANALSKLSSGALTVWAAAWGSTIDPDMYQVYHMDSTATSTLNWGYKQILANVGGKYSFEKGKVEKLSEIIDDARKTNDQDDRAYFYKEALDIVMELAVELPTYQRNDLFAYNVNKIDRNSLTPDSGLSAFYGLTTNLHTVSLVVA